MTKANITFVHVFTLYCIVSTFTIFLRLFLTQLYGSTSPLREKFTLDNIENNQLIQRYIELIRAISIYFIYPFLFILVVFAILLPNPWRNITATLGYDVGHALSVVAISKLFYFSTECATLHIGGGPFFDNLNYNPANNPYYVSNLD